MKERGLQWNYDINQSIRLKCTLLLHLEPFFAPHHFVFNNSS